MSDITDNPETPRSGRRGAARRGAVDPVTSSPGRDLPAFEDESHLLDGDDVPGQDLAPDICLILYFCNESVWNSGKDFQLVKWLIIHRHMFRR